MLSVEEALVLVASHIIRLEPRRLPLDEVDGLVLAENVVSTVDSPPYDKSLMDGYAVVSSDRAPKRRILEEIGAGTPPSADVTPGVTTRVMTGAPIPRGADAVVPIEQVEQVDDKTVRLTMGEPKSGQHILHQGGSLRIGQTVLCAGIALRPIEIAILAEIGQETVLVQPRPHVAVIPTGNELVPVGETIRMGQIPNSNGPMLTAAARRAGANAFELEIARDDHDDLRRKIEQGLSADVLLLSGGVSAGKFDLVPSVLDSLGVELVFHKVALRPGKPLWFGVKNDAARHVLVFGLPGNPVSSFVCFELFARPAIMALAGRGFNGPTVIVARLAHAYEHGGGRAAYLPARVTEPAAGEGLPKVEILSWHGSADLAALAHANGLLRLPGEKLHLAAGGEVDVIRM
jgi:molybdopterin molybdotransferase